MTQSLFSGMNFKKITDRYIIFKADSQEPVRFLLLT